MSYITIQKASFFFKAHKYKKTNLYRYLGCKSFIMRTKEFKYYRDNIDKNLNHLKSK